MRRFFLALTAAALLASGAARASEGEALKHQEWPWLGVFGKFDLAQLRRGFQVYNEVCSACHSLNLLAYRNLAEIGIPAAKIKAIAADKEVLDGPNDQGEMFHRPAKPSDRFVPPFANEQAARAAMNGALPPDLSLIIKAREGGPDYVYGILTGFADAPAGFKVADGMYYNRAFPGHQIAMPPPLEDGRVTYADGTKNTTAQEARDAVAFLTWAAEPNLTVRHELGIKVLLFVAVLTVLFYALKRKVWSDLH